MKKLFEVNIHSGLIFAEDRDDAMAKLIEFFTSAINDGDEVLDDPEGIFDDYDLISVECCQIDEGDEDDLEP